MRLPKDALVDMFEGQNAIKARETSLNKTAVKLHAGRLRIREGSFEGSLVDEHRGFQLVTGGGNIRACLYAGTRGRRVRLDLELERPKIIIDYGLWPYHSKKEKWLVKKQTFLALQEVRRFLWDKCLTLASCPSEVSSHLANQDFFGEVLRDRYKGEAVLLDPHASQELHEFDPDKAYIIGGIVDRSNRIRTSSLGYDCPRARLTVDGDTGAVPDRINLITRMICLNVLGTPLNRAIRLSHS